MYALASLIYKITLISITRLALTSVLGPFAAYLVEFVLH